MLPASVTVQLAFIWMVPKVIAAEGVIVPVPLNVWVLPEAKVIGVVVAVRPFANLMVLPYDVFKAGAVAPPKFSDGAEVPLKLRLPVLVTAIVPDLVSWVIELVKFMVPELTVITSVNIAVLLSQVIVPPRVKVPVVTFTLHTRVVPLLLPVNNRLPPTVQVPALTSSIVYRLSFVGCTKVRSLLTVRVTPLERDKERLLAALLMFR